VDQGVVDRRAARDRAGQDPVGALEIFVEVVEGQRVRAPVDLEERASTSS
jgi:hypothetical protein